MKTVWICSIGANTIEKIVPKKELAEKWLKKKLDFAKKYKGNNLRGWQPVSLIPNGFVSRALGEEYHIKEYKISPK